MKTFLQLIREGAVNEVKATAWEGKHEPEVERLLKDTLKQHTRIPVDTSTDTDVKQVLDRFTKTYGKSVNTFQKPTTPGQYWPSGHRRERYEWSTPDGASFALQLDYPNEKKGLLASAVVYLTGKAMHQLRKFDQDAYYAKQDARRKAHYEKGKMSDADFETAVKRLQEIAPIEAELKELRTKLRSYVMASVKDPYVKGWGDLAANASMPIERLIKIASSLIKKG